MAIEQIIKDFSEKMLAKIQLRNNRYAPLGWKTMDTKRILSLLKNEIAEYEVDGNPDEAIDIANYAMFLYELSKKNTK